jgi:predicted Zn-dependent peptidase
MTLVDTRPEVALARPRRLPPVSAHGGGAALAADLPGQWLAGACLVYDAGAVREPADRYGVASQAARAATEAGTGRGPNAHAQALERLGARVTATVGYDCLHVYVEAPVDRLAAAVALAGEAVQAPRLDSDLLDRLRSEAVDRLRVSSASAWEAAGVAMRGRLFDGGRHSVAPAGTPASNARVTRDDVAEFHARWMAAPQRLLLAGDLARLDVEGLARTAEVRDPAARSGSDAPAPRPAPAAPAVLFVDRPDAVQSTLMLAHRAPGYVDHRYGALAIATTVLGGQFSSRLNRRLREDRGYTYDAGAILDSFRAGGTLLAYSAVHAAATASALLDAVAEVRRLAVHGVSEAEFAAARGFHLGHLPITLQTPAGATAAMVTLVVHGLGPDFLTRRYAELATLTREAVDSAANALVRVDDLSVVVVGDARRYHRAVVEAGLGEVTLLMTHPRGELP